MTRDGRNPPEVTQARSRANLSAGAIGNVIEWYDFAAYGYLAPTIGRLFFPSDDHVASLLAAFSVFAIGYAARPVGGLFFGYLGDRFGRKRMLLLSISLMALSSLCIAMLPDDRTIGIYAAWLLVMLRILQGISVGGELTGSVVFVAEHAPVNKRGLHTGLLNASALSGFVLGSAVCALVTQFLGTALMGDWGWRVPFLIGTAIAVFGLLLRRGITEPANGQEPSEWPIAVVLRDHWRNMLQIIALILAATISFYLYFVYAASFLTERMHMATGRALEINTVNLIVVVVMTLATASISDRIGRKKILILSSMAALVFLWPSWWLMQQQTVVAVLLGQFLMALPIGGISGVWPAMMAELLPRHVRCSGSSIGYNLTVGLFGGTTPLVATYLVSRTGDAFAPAYYLIPFLVLQLAVVSRLPETARKPLDR